MGLDMYLKAKVYLSKYDKEEKDKADKIRVLFPEIPLSGNLDSVEVKFEIGYWRKANAIHKWFVDNVQEGNDNCGTYSVSREKLIELQKCVKEVFTEKARVVKRLNKDYVPKIAKELMPTTGGFFFGGVEYDEYYFDNMEATLKIIEKCLKLPDEYSFEYYSSW